MKKIGKIAQQIWGYTLRIFALIWGIPFLIVGFLFGIAHDAFQAGRELERDL